MNQRIVKIGINILFMLSIPAIVGAFVFAEVSTKDEICNNIIITFSNNQLSFVTKENISEVLNQKGIEAHKTKLRKLNITDLEKTIEESKWVNNSNIFVAADNSIHIKIDQKVPVLRMQPTSDYEEPYYLDQYGNAIPTSTQYTADLPVVTAPEIGFTSADLSLKSDLVTLAKYIAKDTFWNLAITQININEQKSISIIPAFGSQEIILGTIENLDNKMSKLFQFYKQGYNTVNWDKYDEIDLRFERQVVCRNNRGLRISVDPYDKSTHKTNIELANKALPKQNSELVAVAKVNTSNRLIAPKTITSKERSVAVVKKQTLPIEPSTLAIARPNAEITQPKSAVEKSKVLSTKNIAVGATSIPKPIVKKETSKKESKEVVKAKTELAEDKAKAIEVKESKYFK